MTVAVDKYGTGQAYTLADGEDLSVALQISVTSIADIAILGGFSGHSLAVNGLVNGQDGGIVLGAGLGTTSGQSLTIGALGRVMSGTGLTDVGVAINSNTSTVTNAGFIFGYMGLSISGLANPSAPNAQSQLVNTGTIMGVEWAVDRLPGATETLRILNKGLIAGQVLAIDGGGDSTEIVINQGKIKGDVHLRDGNDLFDDRGGTLLIRNDGAVGKIIMGDGNDRVIPGAARELFWGGDTPAGSDTGVDIIDFRFTSGIRFALNGSFAATGVAAGDSYSGFEVVYGSLKGADFLRGLDMGEGLHNKLYGFGGNDRLEGLGGNDTLAGGTGRDSLSGGLGDDVFLYSAPSEGRDVIRDFHNAVGDDDVFQFRLAGFKSGLALGELDASRFHKGRSNHAGDRGDRFIYDQRTTTLWFDADGTGSKKPVLIADLQAGAFVTFSDIHII